MALKNKFIAYYPLLFQLIRFGSVGVTAASTHFAFLVFFVEIGKLNPLAANVFAFLVSFQVSYWGHRYWTFYESTTSHRFALPRLFLVCGSSFLINESLYYMFLNVFHLSYQIALIPVLLILPIANFTLGKLWVFR